MEWWILALAAGGVGGAGGGLAYLLGYRAGRRGRNGYLPTEGRHRLDETAPGD